MSTLRTALIAMALVAGPALAACGDDEEAPGPAAPAATPTPTATADAALPAGLAGTWKVTLKPADVRRAPADIRGRTSRWQMEFHKTGGVDDGPSMTLSNAEMGTFVVPISVSGEQIAIEEFVECRNLTYAVDGDRLAFQPSESGCVREHTLPAVLATRPWRRSQ